MGDPGLDPGHFFVVVVDVALQLFAGSSFRLGDAQGRFTSWLIHPFQGDFGDCLGRFEILVKVVAGELLIVPHSVVAFRNIIGGQQFIGNLESEQIIDGVFIPGD